MTTYASIYKKVSDEEMKMSFAERKQKEKEGLIATYKSYVNKKARVYFEGKWYTATILSFDVDKMRHQIKYDKEQSCLLYTSPSPRDLSTSRMPSSA